MDLRLLAETLQMPVARIWTAGDQRITLDGTPLEGLYADSYCALKVADEEGHIAAAIDVVDAALRRAPEWKAALQDAHMRKSLYCTVMNEGEVLDFHCLEKLLEWRITLEIAAC